MDLSCTRPTHPQAFAQAPPPTQHSLFSSSPLPTPVSLSLDSDSPRKPSLAALTRALPPTPAPGRSRCAPPVAPAFPPFHG